MKNQTLMLFVQLATDEREHPFRWHVKRGSDEEQTCCGEHAIVCRSAMYAPIGSMRESAIDLFEERIDEQTPIELCGACLEALDRDEDLERINITDRAKRLFDEMRGGSC